nr:energy-coupling factor transporter ATPase [bacterium]
MAQPLIEVENAVYGYAGEETPVLKGVSFSIEEGEFVAIVGRNGSGKSTLAKLLNGLFTVKEGAVRVAGLDASNPDNTRGVRQTVGMVFQNPDNQLVASIVEEDVAFGPENLGVEPARMRELVAQALREVGMQDKARRSVHALSGGQKQRVAIAGALAMRPRALVLDEPTAMLDPVGRKEVLEAVRRLNREEGITIILITHFMEEVLSAGRVIALDLGKMVFDGPPRDFFADAQRVRSLGLDVPRMAELAQCLRAGGMPIAQDAMELGEVTEAICRLFLKT